MKIHLEPDEHVNISQVRFFLLRVYTSILRVVIVQLQTLLYILLWLLPCLVNLS